MTDRQTHTRERGPCREAVAAELERHEALADAVAKACEHVLQLAARRRDVQNTQHVAPGKQLHKRRDTVLERRQTPRRAETNA
jgi:hypothetical protein